MAIMLAHGNKKEFNKPEGGGDRASGRTFFRAFYFLWKKKMLKKS